MNEDKKKQLATAVKWGLGLLAAAIIAPAVFLAVRGLIGLIVAGGGGGAGLGHRQFRPGVGDEIRQLEAQGPQAQGVLTTTKKAELQKLCTDAANNIPITRDWAPNDPPAPLGCILDESSPNHGGYCDDCPARRICPHTGKEYSQ